MGSVYYFKLSFNILILVFFVCVFFFFFFLSFSSKQEEKIEPASSNNTFQSDSSWKLPPSSHVLMRASQVSSQFKQEDQSYLRLSFGQFFGQRSEALGCLGSTDDVDGVKRVSKPLSCVLTSTVFICTQLNMFLGKTGNRFKETWLLEIYIYKKQTSNLISPPFG